MKKTPFVIDIPESTLRDLAARLAHTRWPHDFANEDWRYGTNAAYLKELVDYWRTQYDWRRHEAEMNTFAHYRADIDGMLFSWPDFVPGVRRFGDEVLPRLGCSR